MVQPLTGGGSSLLGLEVQMLRLGLEMKKCNESRNEKPGIDPGMKDKGAGKIGDGLASQGPREFQQLV
jgi:hypothetical protein